MDNQPSIFGQNTNPTQKYIIQVNQSNLAAPNHKVKVRRKTANKQKLGADYNPNVLNPAPVFREHRNLVSAPSSVKNARLTEDHLIFNYNNNTKDKKEGDRTPRSVRKRRDSANTDYSFLSAWSHLDKKKIAKQKEKEARMLLVGTSPRKSIAVNVWDRKSFLDVEGGKRVIDEKGNISPYADNQYQRFDSENVLSKRTGTTTQLPTSPDEPKREFRMMEGCAKEFKGLEFFELFTPENYKLKMQRYKQEMREINEKMLAYKGNLHSFALNSKMNKIREDLQGKSEDEIQFKQVNTFFRNYMEKLNLKGKHEGLSKFSIDFNEFVNLRNSKQVLEEKDNGEELIPKIKGGKHRIVSKYLTQKQKSCSLGEKEIHQMASDIKGKYKKEFDQRQNKLRSNLNKTGYSRRMPQTAPFSPADATQQNLNNSDFPNIYKKNDTSSGGLNKSVVMSAANSYYPTPRNASTSYRTHRKTLSQIFQRKYIYLYIYIYIAPLDQFENNCLNVLSDSKPTKTK